MKESGSMCWFQSTWPTSCLLMNLKWLPNQAWPHGRGSTHITMRRSRRTWCLCPASMFPSARGRPSSPSTSSWVCCPPPPATACLSGIRHAPGRTALLLQSIVLYRTVVGLNTSCVSAIDLHFRFGKQSSWKYTCVLTIMQLPIFW